MTGRELLEMAAKAGGIVGAYDSWVYQGFNEGIRTKGCVRPWNSLRYIVDAHALSCRLHINITHGKHSVRAWTDDDAPVMVDETVSVLDEADRSAKTCEATTRAAAAIGASA